jgi:hypothetical protein
VAELDAPDWEHIVVTVQATGDVPDAPDWEHIVVGPGGTPIGGGGVPGSGTSISPYFLLGFKALSADPAYCTSNIGHTNSVLSLMIFTPPVTATLENLWVGTASDASMLPNENFLCIYDTGQATAGTATLLGQTAAGAADFGLEFAEVEAVALESSVSVTAGQLYYFGLITNGNGATAQITAAQAPNNYTLNPISITPPPRAYAAGPYTTAPPASVTISSLIITNTTWLMYGS